MPMRWPRQRTYAVLLFIGAAFLAYRTLAMISAGALQTLVPWVNFLLMLELIADGIAMVVCAAWAISGRPEQVRAVIRATTAVVIIHAVRVLIFVLGRTGPWVDFDVKPEARAQHADSWTWGEVYFAGSMSAISVIALIVFWIYWRRKRQALDEVYRTPGGDCGLVRPDSED
ncbi:MAG: hypothetical protein AMJ68_06660 [Acidithiobacillales bacterium SG8_45]|jgi:hypothetical protein|nr:MAG: hypothetical protein AMJ68_06660 [Acidithiobacillales bacterium SG8_45]